MGPLDTPATQTYGKGRARLATAGGAIGFAGLALALATSPAVAMVAIPVILGGTAISFFSLRAKARRARAATLPKQLGVGLAVEQIAEQLASEIVNDREPPIPEARVVHR